MEVARQASASRLRMISRRLAAGFAVIVAVAFAVYLSMPKAHDDGSAHSFARERPIAEEHGTVSVHIERPSILHTMVHVCVRVIGRR